MGTVIGRVVRGLAALGLLAVATIALAMWWGARDTTVYATGFNEKTFERVESGMSVDQVYELLGPPLETRRETVPERWCYGEPPLEVDGSAHIVRNFFQKPPCVLFDQAGFVIEVRGDGIEGIRSGMSTHEVLDLLGEPRHRAPAVAQTLHYTRPGGNGLFRGRIVAVDASGRVSDVIRYHFYD
jgi:outer membrane protein assembly factor BamE (lipoprotein component of BamABCDE complex)